MAHDRRVSRAFRVVGNVCLCGMSRAAAAPVVRRIHLFAFLLASFPLAALAGCASVDTDVEGSPAVADEPLTRVSSAEQSAAALESLAAFRYDHLTPTSERVMHAARYWMRVQDQDPRYPNPRQCASNVSKVLFLSGIYGFDQEGVRRLVDDVRAAGGRTIVLPNTGDKLPAAMNQLDGGHIPAGTLVAGMNVSSAKPGDQHIGFIGHTDPDGTVWIYHNNWYRPESEGGARRPYMVSDQNLRRGFQRQWMATPWIRVRRDATGKIISVRSLMPQIDDMDPTNAEYRVTMAIVPEVLGELAQGLGR